MRIHCPARCPLNQHADVVCSRAQFNRAKGSPEGRRPFGGVKGQSTLGSPINTRALYANVLNSIARKGVQRVEDPLAGSRGSAPWVPQSTRGRCMQSRSTQSRKGRPEGRRPFGRCRAEPCRSPEAEPLAPPSERNCYEETEAVVCGDGLGALRVERGEELVRIRT